MACDEELTKALKDLPLKILTSSLKERKVIFDNVKSILNHPGITENIVRGLCKVLQSTLPRYRDSLSHGYVTSIIASLSHLHSEWTLKHLSPLIAEIATNSSNLVPTKSTAQSCIYPLAWSTHIVLNYAHKKDLESAGEWKALLSAQSLLLSSVLAAENQRKTNKAIHILYVLWKLYHPMWEPYRKGIMDFPETFQSVVFGAVFLGFLYKIKQREMIPNLKAKLVEVLIKTVIMNKTRVPTYVVQGCKPLLLLVNHDDFTEKILPALQKALLRNPEFTLCILSTFLSNLSIDLSIYALNLGKTIGKNLCSNDDNVRRQATESLKAMASQCSDPDALSSLAEHLFQIFNGSLGKITVTAHKITVLQGIGDLSMNVVVGGGCVYSLARTICEFFLKILEVEVHERTLIHCLEMMSLWCMKFTTGIPPAVLSWLEKGITLKTSTPLVRISYIGVMNICCHSATIRDTSRYLPFLLKSVEKAAAQPSQALAVSEGLRAACLLLKMCSYDALGPQLAFLHSVILDMEKQVFISDKFLSQASPEAICEIVTLCERILMEHIMLIQGNPAPLYRALAICMTTKSVKTKCKPLLQRMFSSLHGTQIACSLLDEFTELVIKNKFQVANKENGEQHNGQLEEIKPRNLVDAVTMMCSGTNLSLEDKKQLAFHAVLVCHHPLIESVQPTLWAKIVKHFKLEPKSFVQSYLPNFVEKLVTNFKPEACYKKAIATITSVNPEEFLPNLLENVKKDLSNSDVLNVTDLEYAIYMSSPDELYDNTEPTSTVKNMKRESKAYSYREQQEELALRKELEEKKRKQGKISEPELTPKQKELIRIQLEKEAALRDRLKMVADKLYRARDILVSALDGSPFELSLHFTSLIPLIVRGFSSPLSAEVLTQLYVKLNKAAFFGVKLSSVTVDKISYTILRLLKPKCEINKDWTESNLDKSTAWVVDEISKRSEKITASALTYVFPMIETVIKSNPNDNLKTNLLNFISVQCKFRTLDKKNVHNPELLPRKQILLLCIEIIGSTSGRIQQQGINCILDLANASSGAEGCAVASTEELDCLLVALQHPSEHVRDAALRALWIVVPIFPKAKQNAKLAFNITKRIWVAKFDVVSNNREIAEKVWDSANLISDQEGLSEGLLVDIIHPVTDIQQAAAHALHELLVNAKQSEINMVIQLLLNIYYEKSIMIPAKVDSLGRVVEQPIDTWEPRSGVALALQQLAPLLTKANMAELARFYVDKGLGDVNETVRDNMRGAALEAVNLHGKECVNVLLPILEPVLDQGPNCSSYDAVRQSVVILMGSLARHLDKDDPKIKPIVSKLIDALSTPAQQVQEAVANCLPALVPSIKEEAPALVQKLLDQLLSSKSYGQRRGAAYGLAGIVKGMGILVLKQLDIMTKLTLAIQDKQNYKQREGALFAFEMLCSVLGRLFEPYIVHVLPHLLLCFGDSNQYVRAATDDCAKVVMSKLSAHGVKLILPSLLTALESDSWRTKTGSVELLGAMAFCAPKQLSSCLPNIVPKLIEVLSDSHVKVQNAGTEALKQIGSVIRNPEIQAIVPILLEALQDPSNKTATCLQTLLDTQFVHFIDAPSLALIMPVVQRAFMDRSTETRKMAAQIIGNMYSLTDQKDLTPYLPNIIPGLKTSLLDPVPEVRSVSARALGAMVKGMGESSCEELLPWLMKTLTSESSSVDRSGAAQGLSEVVGGLGVEKLHKVMPEIISTAERSDIAPHVKDGYIMMFIYMPVVFTKEFTPYIGEIITPILKALADENEYVRDTALKAGQRIVNLYADSAITLLLPELENGLFDENWRIRYSSVQLLGDLLYRISGVSGKMSTETANEDDNFGTEQSHKAIIGALGGERRNRVLAGLYMGRSDVALMVRQAALHVWKVVVTNTPRTLREILPTLFSLLLGCLASTSHDKRTVAAKTLGDLVRKLGERVLPEIIPILEKGLESDQSDQRQGVCIGLSEIMASTSRDMVLTFVNSLVPTVRKALSDPLPEVRQAAARTFDSLHSTVGVRALDDILPSMLQQLNNPDPDVAEWTLDGLRQVMAIKSRVVLPYLVPQLTATPVNTKALSILASVAGDALTKYLHKILPALLSALAVSEGSQQELEYCQTVVLSVVDETGICAIINQLLEATKNEKVQTRKAATTLLCAFCTNTRADYSQHVPQLLRGLIYCFNDEDPTVLQMSWEALSAVTKSLDPSQQIMYVGDVRQAVKFAVSDLKNNETLLPGLCLPKGITPVLPLFREAILNGTPEVKESAAQGLGEVISLTTPQSLQPSVIHITGPLIRILGDRFPPFVKAAVLHTLAILLGKVGMMLKQFLPQLQTTFLKALNDNHRLVRLKAATALSYLITIHTRPDPLFVELHAAIKSAEEPGVRETMMQALRGVVSKAGDKMSEPVLRPIYASLLSMLSSSEDTTRNGAAGCVGAIIRWLPDDMLPSTLDENLLVEDVSLDWVLRHGRSAALFVALKEAPTKIYTSQYETKVQKVLLSYFTADRVQIVMSGIRGCGYLFDYLMENGKQLPQQLLSQFVRSMNHTNNEVKQLVAKVCSYLSRREIKSPEFLKSAIPMLVNGTKEKNSYVKANSEFSLVSVLRLRQNDDKLQETLALLDPGAAEALSDVITKVLRKIQPEGKLEELDDTLLT